MVEAMIDFEEDEDLGGGVWEHGRYSHSSSAHNLGPMVTAQQSALELLGKIRETLNDGKRGEIIRQGIKLAIFGPPNAGKSTLLNFFGTMSSPLLS